MKTLLEDRSIRLEEDFVPDSHPLFSTLVSTIVWDERIRARKVASFGLPYNYSGTVWPEAPFPEALHEVFACLAVRLGYEPNNCLANYYPDGSSGMGYHFDATDDLEAGTGIAIISLGSERGISFRSSKDKQVLEKYTLRSGS